MHGVCRRQEIEKSEMKAAWISRGSHKKASRILGALPTVADARFTWQLLRG
jgi:hypothetical protein